MEDKDSKPFLPIQLILGASAYMPPPTQRKQPK